MSARPGRLLLANMKARAMWGPKEIEETRRRDRAGRTGHAATLLEFPWLSKKVPSIEEIRRMATFQDVAIQAYRDGDTPESLRERVKGSE